MDRIPDRGQRDHLQDAASRINFKLEIFGLEKYAVLQRMAT
jgi:hypothetical protein